MGRLVIYGAGGFGREVITAARAEDRPIALLSDGPVPAFAKGIIIRHDELLPDDEVVIAVSNGATRRALAAKSLRWGSLRAPNVIIGDDVEIGEGAIFCDHTMVTAGAQIGAHFHANIYSYVAHDCLVGDFVTFAPRVSCNGNVHIGDGAYIGTGAIIHQGRPGRPLSIGAGSIVGMGAVVTRSVPPGCTVMGNPARVIVRPAEAA